jgi:hypothetical protein
MCNLYSITTNQAAIIALFRVINRYVGNLPPMPGVFPDYPAPVVRNAGAERELTMMRWGMPPPPRTGGPPVTNIRNTASPHWPLLAFGGIGTEFRWREVHAVVIAVHNRLDASARFNRLAHLLQEGPKQASMCRAGRHRIDLDEVFRHFSSS